MIETWVEQQFVPFLSNLVIVLIIKLLGQIVIRVLLKVGVKILRNAQQDEIFIRFLRRISNILLQLLLLVIVLTILGVNTGYLLAVLGAVGIALALAFQDSLQNFTSGILMLVFAAFHAGDEVELQGMKANVEEIGVYSTKMRTKDNRLVFIPNAVFTSMTVVNNTALPTRRIDLVIRVNYETDLAEVIKLLSEVLASDDRVLKEPEPKITIAELAESSVRINVRPWVKTEEYGFVLDALREKIKSTFDARDIPIAYRRFEVATIVGKRAEASGN